MVVMESLARPHRARPMAPPPPAVFSAVMATMAAVSQGLTYIAYNRFRFRQTQVVVSLQAQLKPFKRWLLKLSCQGNDCKALR